MSRFPFPPQTPTGLLPELLSFGSRPVRIKLVRFELIQLVGQRYQPPLQLCAFLRLKRNSFRFPEMLSPPNFVAHPIEERPSGREAPFLARAQTEMEMLARQVVIGAAADQRFLADTPEPVQDF